MGRFTFPNYCSWLRFHSVCSLLSKGDCKPCQNLVKIEEKMLLEKTDFKSSTSDTSEDLENSNIRTQVPKRKFAIMLAYCGYGYYGMQMNLTKPDFPTIESTLISALIKAQCIPETFETKQLKFQRCARTDKGVSALGQLVSLRLLAPYSNPVEKINLYLPPEIRIADIKRVTKGFSSKDMCDGRSYSYLVPTFSLSRYTASVPDSNFRLPREDFHHINKLLSCYKGTHNFHNFTSRKTFEEPNAWRHMFDVSCSEPFVHCGTEFSKIIFTGQSFMLYQIRKMVGLIIAAAQGVVPADFLLQCMQMDKVNIPPAPALGLILEHTHFDKYNKRYGGDGFHQTISWEETMPVLSAFWEEKILPHILEGELENFSMCYWIETIKRHNFFRF